MKCALAVVVLVVVGVGTVYTQSPPVPPPGAPGFPDEERKSASPKDATIDQLLDQIVKLRQQQAELKKKELDLMTEVQKKLGKQTERLNQLGIPQVGMPARCTRSQSDSRRRGIDPTRRWSAPARRRPSASPNCTRWHRSQWSRPGETQFAARRPSIAPAWRTTGRPLGR